MRPLPAKKPDFTKVKEQISELEKSREHYKSLAEAQEFTIDTILKPSVEIMEAQGVLISMIGEVTAYGIKQGRNERYQLSMDRLTMLSDFVLGCSKISDHNYRLRYMLACSIKKRDELQEENAKLRQELEAINQAFNAE